MKTLKILSVVAFAALFIGQIQANSFSKDSRDKVVEKAREAVANNFNKDWKVYAKSADQVIKRGKALDEAKQWLESSIEIKKTPYNLEVMGDYFMKVGDKENALKYFYKSMILLKETSIDPQTEPIQQKIMDARS